MMTLGGREVEEGIGGWEVEEGIGGWEVEEGIDLLDKHNFTMRPSLTLFPPDSTGWAARPYSTSILIFPATAASNWRPDLEISA